MLKAGWFRSDCARGVVVHAMHSVFFELAELSRRGTLQYSHGTTGSFVRRRLHPLNGPMEALSAVVDGTYALSGS